MVLIEGGWRRTYSYCRKDILELVHQGDQSRIVDVDSAVGVVCQYLFHRHKTAIRGCARVARGGGGHSGGILLQLFESHWERQLQNKR